MPRWLRARQVMIDCDNLATMCRLGITTNDQLILGIVCCASDGPRCALIGKRGKKGVGQITFLLCQDSLLTPRVAFDR